MELTVPSDKSMSHRALFLAALAEGESRIRNVLTGADPAATAGILRELGVEVPDLPTDGGEIRIRGVGLRGLREPDAVLDCANSGTTARLLLGILAGQELQAVVDGDESLRTRPMRRVTGPLGTMGARFEELDRKDRLPIRVGGARLNTLEYELPVASAQVKSALLLAGITGGASVLLTEPGRSRDHTERMLALMGVSLHFQAVEGGWQVELRTPPKALQPLDFTVPGDISSAAFLLALGLLGGAGDAVAIPNVGVNPTRAGILPVLERMGAELDLEGLVDGGEPVGRLVARPSELVGTEVGGDEIPMLLDEVPVLAVLAARARGTTRITGAEELRVKESDRLAVLAANLQALGVEVQELEDGLVVEGTSRPLEGVVESRGDHRIAMAFGILAALPENSIRVRGREAVEVSFPDFWETLARARREADR